MAGSNAHRNVSVDITGDANDLKRAYDDAMRSSKKFDDEMDGSSNRFSDRMKRMGSDVADFSGNSAIEFSKLGMRAELIWSAILAGIFALGPASQLTAGLMTLAFGSALAGIGVMAAAESGKVRGEFTALWQDIKSDLVEISAPIEASLMRIPDIWRNVFSIFRPELESAFSDLGPVLTQFFESFSLGFAALAPAIEPLKRGISALLISLGMEAPELFGNLADAITTFAATTERHADDFSALLSGFFALIAGFGSVIDRLAGDWDHFMGSVEAGLAYVSNGNWRPDLNNSTVEMQRALDTAANLIKRMHEITVVYEDAAVSVDTFTSELNELNGVHVDADLAALRYAEAVMKVNGLISDGAHGLDIYNASNQGTVKALLDMVKTSHSLLEAKAKEGATVRELNSLFEVHRHKLYEVAKQLTGSEHEAKRLVDRYLQFPKSIETRIQANTSDAQSNVDRFITLNSGREIPIHIINKNSADGGLVNYANGGLIKGQGGSRSDRVPINASRNEYIVNAAATRRHLPLLEAINGGKVPAGGGVGGTTIVYNINTTVAPTANLAAVGAEVVKSIQAFEQRSSATWRQN